MMRRFAAFLLALGWALALSACGGPAGDLPGSGISAPPSAAQTDRGTQSPDPAPEDTAPETPAPGDPETPTPEAPETPEDTAPAVSEDGWYDSKDEVALYIHLYGHLPGNYITKKQAEKLGWDSSTGNLWDVAPGMSIGGSRFGNYEGALPDKKGRTYYECDIDYDGGYRGAKRIIYSDDGLIFYTEDHYKTFEELYGQ